MNFLRTLKALPDDFSAKGACLYQLMSVIGTQSGKLHEAMKAILPEAMFIGFTGTPLMKKDKKKSLEVFGPLYPHLCKLTRR